MSSPPGEQPQAPHDHQAGASRPRGKPSTLFLWAALVVLLVVLGPVCSLVTYVAVTNQPVSLGGDTLLLEAQSVPVPPSASFIEIDPNAASDSHRSCSGGRCTETNCYTRELFISRVKIALTDCTTTTTP
jgi:hypothetical protein